MKKEIVYDEKAIFEYGKDLIHYADMDFKASKLLYNNQLNSLTLYHIQQAVEKLAKAEMLFQGGINIEDLRNISHITPKTFIFAMKKAKKDPNIEKILKKIIPPEEEKKAELLLYDHQKIIDSNKEELIRLMNFYDNELTMKEVREKIDNELESHGILPKKSNPNASEFVYMNLYLLSWITFCHEAITRYPGGIISPKDYTEEKPFVQVIPNLIEKIEKVLTIMKSYKIKEEISK